MPEHGHSAILRDKTLALRTQWRNELAELKACLKQYTDSKAQFMAAVRSVETTVPHLDVTRAIHKLSKVLEKDEFRLSESIARAQHVEPELSRLDYEMLENDKGSMTGQQNMFKLEKAESNFEGLARRNAEESKFSCNSDGLPEDVSNYFDAVGDTRLMVIKLQEDLPVEFQEELAERERRLSQDIPLDVSEDVFRQAWESKIRQATDELLRLQERAKALREICLEKGLDTNPAFYTQRNESEESASISTGEAIRDWLQDIPTTSRMSMPEDSISCSQDSLDRHGDLEAEYSLLSSSV